MAAFGASSVDAGSMNTCLPMSSDPLSWQARSIASRSAYCTWQKELSRPSALARRTTSTTAPACEKKATRSSSVARKGTLRANTVLARSRATSARPRLGAAAGARARLPRSCHLHVWSPRPSSSPAAAERLRLAAAAAYGLGVDPGGCALSASGVIVEAGARPRACSHFCLDELPTSPRAMKRVARAPAPRSALVYGARAQKARLPAATWYRGRATSAASAAAGVPARRDR